RTARIGADPNLRRAALRACSHRPSAQRCQAPAHVALHDPDATVRRAALDAVRATGADARPLLARLSSADPDPNLRRYASDQLAKSSAPPSAAQRVDWRPTVR